MTPADLAQLGQLFLDGYIVGFSEKAQSAMGGPTGPGIRHRQPAIVSIPPSYEPLPNAAHDTVFLPGDGPEDSPVRARFIDRCPLERAVVTAGELGADIEFLFVTRYDAGEFEGVAEPVTLPSGDALHAVVTECLHKLLDFTGTDTPAGDPEDGTLPVFSTEVTVLTLAELRNRKLLPVP